MKLETINEALRFGQREINSLKKQANNILVSFEYEFTFMPGKYDAMETGEEYEGTDEVTLHPWANEDGDFDPEIDDIREHHSWEEEWDRAVEREADYLVGEDPFDADDLESDLDSLDNELDEAGIDTTRTLTSYIEEFKSVMLDDEPNYQEIARVGMQVNTIFDTILQSDLYDSLDGHADDYENGEGRLGELDSLETIPSISDFDSSLPDGGSMETFAEIANSTAPQQQVFDFFQAIMDKSYESMKEDWMIDDEWDVISEFIKELDQLLINKDHIGSRYRDSVMDSAMERARESESAEDDAEREVRENMEREFDDEIETGDFSGSVGGRERFSVVRSLIGNPNNKWGLPSQHLEAVADDPSVTNGVEVTFYAQPINDAIDTMRKMFRLIEEIGSTADNTAGLHTNVSIRGRDMHVKNINPFRMVMMADQDYLLRNFPIRRFVSRMLPRNVDYIAISKAIEAYVEGGTKDLVEWSEDNLIKDEKYQTINFLNAMGYVPEDRRRVEFRAPGGADYHKDPDKVEWHTWRMVHLLNAITSEDFEDKDYFQKVYKYWEKASQLATGMSFGTLVNEYRNTGELPGGSGLKPSDISGFPRHTG